MGISLPEYLLKDNMHTLALINLGYGTLTA